MQVLFCVIEKGKAKVVYTFFIMAGRPSFKKPTEYGARLARLRKEAGLSQVQLAKLLDIPQRTLSFYERQADHIPSTLLPKLAQTLGVTIEEVLGLTNDSNCRRGPKSKLERMLEDVRKLPRSDQQFVVKFLDQVLSRKAG